MSFKRTKVVMLPTNEKASLHLLGNELGYTLHQNSNPLCKQQHLYFLSDEEIKEGDWYMNNGIIFKADDKFDEGNNPNQNKNNKKIIATTDSSLIIKEVFLIKNERGSISTNRLPQPSVGFIQKFVDAYNSGKPITEVGVELELSDYDIACDRWQLKVNPKDNTITIKKAKDSWSREEVIELLEKIVKDEPSNLGIVDYWNWHSKWIEENL